MAHHNSYGRWGENLACERLVAQGYAIVKRNWRMEHYELDIVAMKGSELVIVEVKTRSDGSDPVAAVDDRKIARTVASADVFVKTYNLPHNVRFDICGISGTPDCYSIEYIEDAFGVPLKTF